MNVFTCSLSKENVTLTVYLPDKSPEMPHMDTRRGILVIPGGAYAFCSDREAEPVALEFLSAGYAAFVLRYSLNETSAFPGALNDAEEALELIRSKADEWGVDPRKIAAVGFSAGGHLTAALSVMGKQRPNAQILGYPCITAETCKLLASSQPSLEDKVDDMTPPAFIVHAFEDSLVPVGDSLKYAEALNEKKIPFEMHIYQKGYHGFSTAKPQVYSGKEDYENNRHCGTWIPQCLTWLDNLFA